MTDVGSPFKYEKVPMLMDHEIASYVTLYHASEAIT